MDNEKDRKVDVTAMQFLLVQNRHLDWTLIGSGANELGIDAVSSKPAFIKSMSDSHQ